MNYDAVVATALECIPAVREFGELFPNAEHTLVKAKRDLESDGWQIVYEWISRGNMHDRYMVWLVVAIDIGRDDNLSELERPHVYVVEIEKTEGGSEDDNRRSWEFRLAEFEDGDWEQLVQSDGDFGAIGLELRPDAPLEQFSLCWQETRPIPLAEPPDGIAFKAPLRYMMQ
jgi:hypothetical protein